MLTTKTLKGNWGTLLLPIGKDDSENVEVKRWGTVRNFSFKPLTHMELGLRHDIIDVDRGVKLAGSRSYVLKGWGARLEQAVTMSPADAMARLQVVPGVGEWTAAETLQRAMGHPDAISVGDYHLKNWVTHFLTGRARGTDLEMIELLLPWAGQRQRVVRLIELSGVGAPRFGPRFAPTDIRAI